MAAFRHGIAGVERQIQQGVGQLIAIDQSRRRRRTEMRLDVDPLA